MSEQPALVFVVDDDASMRTALRRLMRSVGFDVEVFASAQEFLAAERPDRPGCLVLDVRMPRMSGLELQRALDESGVDLPVIFVTGHGDVPMSVRAMKAGAVDFLLKPFNDQDLIDAVQRAIEKDRARRLASAEESEIRARFATLTPREQEVMAHVVAGGLNKQIAGDLGASEKTIKVHRSRIMHKMAATSLAELVRLAARIGIHGPGDR